MKKSVYLIVACFCIAISSQATVWTVSNDPLNPAQFNDLQIAVDTSIVQDYDTLYVIPSHISYGGLIVNRPLVIIGGGFNPKIENKNVSELNYLVFQRKYDEWDNLINSPENSILIGLKINYIGSIGEDYGERSHEGIDYISIFKCNIIDIHLCSSNADPVIGWNISNNVVKTIDASFEVRYTSDITNNAQNCIINNNIIVAPNYGALRIKHSIINNNLFICDGKEAFMSLSNCSLKNNIFYFTDLNINVSSACNFYNNISYIGGLTDRNGNFTGGTNNTFSDNLENVDPQFVFEEDRIFNFTDDYHLADGSPAIGAGFSGGDLGIFEGTSPYVESGAPSIPQILQMNIHDEMVLGGTNLNVTLKAVKAE